MSVLTDLKNRGVKDVVFLVCDGLQGLPDVVENVGPLTSVQTCLVHLLRNSFRLVSKKRWEELKRDLKPIYTAPNADAALAALDDLEEKGDREMEQTVRGNDQAVAELGEAVHTVSRL